MKKSSLLTSLFSLPLLWFAAYILLIGVGCIANNCGAGDAFYCGFYCKFGLILMAIVTAGYFAFKVFKRPIA